MRKKMGCSENFLKAKDAPFHLEMVEMSLETSWEQPFPQFYYRISVHPPQARRG